LSGYRRRKGVDVLPDLLSGAHIQDNASVRKVCQWKWKCHCCLGQGHSRRRTPLRCGCLDPELGDRPAGQSHAGHRRSPYLFRFTTSTFRRQAALMIGRDAHGRGDLPLNASSAMSGGGSPQVRRVHRQSRCYELRELCPCGSRLPTAVGVLRPRRSRSMVNASRGKS
jgi:hypothetical protein